MRKPPPTTEERARHWDAAYVDRGARGVSWYQDSPRVSLELIETSGVGRDAAILDVGGGASLLVDELLKDGFSDVSVLDLSSVALAETRRRLAHAEHVPLLQRDLLDWQPERRFDLWHDRALLHFLVAPYDRERYVRTLRSAIRQGGYVVLGAFATDGPELCSGLAVRRYSVADFADLVGPAFEVLETRREAHVTPGGATQTFTWVAGRIGSA